MTDDELRQLGIKLVDYCNKYLIPVQYVFDILNDQKVTPMTRGKAMEYNVFLLLKAQLNQSEWSVEKLNLSAQSGTPDEDISITHRRTGIILKVESKSAVRGSMSNGERSRICRGIPHFKVKCHRSRSNISLSETTNDSYSQDAFDLIITNPLNAIYQGKTVGEDLELIHNESVVRILYSQYSVSNKEDLFTAISRDWRFVLPTSIAVDGFIPRTPYVLLTNDPHWLPIGQVESKLLDIVRGRTTRNRSRR